jgi:type I restriction enzyme S subunit
MGDDDTSTVVPRLRFPEFREAGEWCERPLGDFLDYQQPAPFLVSSTEYDPAFKTPVLTAGKTFILGYTNEESGIFDAGLPVIIFDDFTTATQFVTFPFKAKSSAMKILTAKDGADIKFMFELLQAIPYEVGAHERHWISTFAPMLVATPQPAEQQKIADCLTSLDEVIAAQGPKVEALKAHKKGLMQQLFPREGETLPRLRFPEFRDSPEWDVVPLGGLLDGKPEYGVNAAAVPFSEKLPAYLRITDIDEDGRFIPAGRASVDIDANDDNFMSNGDIALARTGASVGKSYPYREEDGRLIFAGFLIRIRPNKRKVVPAFLGNFLTTQQYWAWVRVTSARSGQPGINGTEYATLQVPIPPLSADGEELAEQQRIADCLSSLDDQITAGVHKLAALKLHKKGLMQQLFPSPDDA